MRRSVFLAAVGAGAVILAGAALAAKPGSDSATGTGSVFVSNPVQSLGDESLTDQSDADAAVPAAAYHDVTLTNLDGSGFLHGAYATIESETGNPAYSPTNTFRYTRHQDEFEQVMAYYWITQAQLYVQSLGFGSSMRAIDNRPQAVRIDQWGLDNSFTTDHPKDEIRYGKGGVDDAEDAEVILHEYGHAMHQAQNFIVRLGAGRRDQRGVRRLLGGHGHRRRLAAARRPGARTASMRRGLGLDLVHVDGAALPATCRHRSPLSGRPQRRGAPRRADLVARAVGHPPEPRQRQGGHDHPAGVVRFSGHDDDRPRTAP